MSGQRLNPFQHALKRPDAYIGSVKTTQQETYVFEGDRVAVRLIRYYNIGLLNIIREIGSNCIDNKWRSEREGVPMKCIKVTWDTENKRLTFWNDGVPIPVEKKNYEYEDYRKKTTISEELYPSEVFFGEMLAGTNFNDDEGEERKTSGRNGMGSKCTVVFSKEFTVKNADANNEKQFLQTYTTNGTDRTKPKVRAYNAKTSFTEISFIPDFGRFDYNIEDEEVEADFLGLLGIYVLEIAAVTSLPVHLINGETKRTYHFKTFDKYVRMFYPEAKTHKLASIKLKNGDECIVIESHIDEKVEIPDMLDGVRHLSYVNGVKTKSGGVHVDVWRDAIFPSFVRTFNAQPSKGKNTALKTTAKEVYPYLTLFIRTEVDKPEFDQQTKDLLNGPKYELTPTGKGKFDKEEQARIKEEIEALVSKMLKWNFVPLLKEKLLAKTGKGPSKATRAERRVGFGEKSQDANEAGAHPELCCLYISEGLSSKALCVRGISHLERGQDHNGVFAVQGKFINAKKATLKELMANPEAPRLMKMLNLKIGVKYDDPENFKTLRYHKIRFATDMDDDGIHIRGLLACFFYTFWPELYDIEGMISSISTGVTKVWMVGRKEKDIKLFFSNPEYKKWYEESGKKLKLAEVKYLKGLASINPKDAPGYFEPSTIKIVNYFAEGDEGEYMKLGFEDEADMRKDWILRDMIPDEFTRKKLGLETEEEKSIESEDDYVYDGDLGLSTFVDRQLIIYHKMATERALTSIMDGFKDGQRKVFYSIRKRNYAKTTDLEKVAGAVKELSGYHHGAASLMGTIKNLAIRYPGSNNIALLQSDGEFGTRLSGPSGKDSGQPRYISTALESVAKALFKSEDDPLLKRVIEDDSPAEYEFFVPILCTLLINGAEGIASGWSAKVPNYNPDDILEWTLAWLDGKNKSSPKLKPWYRGINGPIELEYDKGNKEKPIRWRSSGILTECCKGCNIMVGNKKCNGTKGWWHITDLPVGLWTNTFKSEIEYLESCTPPEGTKRKKLESKCITDYKDYNTANKVHFMIKPAKDWEPSIDTTLKKMKSPNSLCNMVLVDTNGYPLKYDSAEEILGAWCERRLVFYDKRYDYIMALHEYDIQKARCKYIYVKAVVDKKLDMYQSDEDLYRDMVKLKLVKLCAKFAMPGETNNEDEEKDEEKDEDKKKKNEPSFDYLLTMHMRSMTVKKLEELKKEIESAKTKMNILKSKTSKDLWREDLSGFQVAYKKYLNDYPLE
jgi:DNA topoisomerase-2